MSNPTPFPTDPLDPSGTDPDLSQDADEPEETDETDENPDVEHPDDREPTFDERRQDTLAADEQGRGEVHIDLP